MADFSIRHSQSKGCLSVLSCYQFCHPLCGEAQAYAVSVYARLCWIQVWKVQLWNIHYPQIWNKQPNLIWD